MSEYLVDFYKWFPKACHTRYYEKKQTKIIFSLESLYFFSKICVFNNLLGPKKCSYKYHSFCQNTLGTFTNGSLRLVILDTTRKKQTKIFFSLESLYFFSKISVLNNLLGPKKCSYRFRSNCQNTFWTLTNCPLGFVTLDNTRTNRPLYFFHWKGCLFFQKYVFSTSS